MDDTHATYRDVGRQSNAGAVAEMCKCDGRHDYMEVGGRVMSGAITEEVLGVTVMYVVYAGALKGFACNKNRLPRVFGTYTDNQGHTDTTTTQTILVAL